MKRNIYKIEIVAGSTIHLGGLLAYGLGIHQLLPVPHPELVVYGTTLIGILLILMGVELFSKSTKEMEILEKDERNPMIRNTSFAKAYEVMISLLILVSFVLIFMGYMNEVVFFFIAGVIGIGQIIWAITAHKLE